MRLNFNKYLVIAASLLCFSQSSFATSVTSCATKSATKISKGWNANFDYGDATGYGEACHDTNRWQQLGQTDGDALKGDTGTGTSSRGGWTEELSQNTVDTGDNGVTWRVQNSDGTWPTEFGTGELVAGANVEYQFVVTRSDEGNHVFDQLKAWNDWNGNGQFDDSEVIIDDKWYKIADTFAADNTAGNGAGGFNNDPLVRNGSKATTWDTINNSGVTEAIVTSIVQIPLDAVIGDTWIRARVICENSLTAHDRDNNILYATGYYHQGEVEDYQVAITQVPEPTTLLVFGSALIGLVLQRKKSV